MNILVTGAAGFIGSHLCERLLANGHTVTGLDCFDPYYAPALKRQNLHGLLGQSRFRFAELDLADDDLAPEMLGCEVVYHLAARPGLARSWTDFETYSRANLTATYRLLDAAADCGTLTRFVYASTSSVYGANAEGDERRPTRPISPYGATKLAAEHLCQAFLDEKQVPVTTLRFFSVYGPRQRPDMAYHRFIRAALRNDPIEVYGDGLQSRGNTFVGDCVAAAARAYELPIGEVYNLGGDEPITVLEVLDHVERLAGRKLRVTHAPRRAGDQQVTLADTTKIRTALNWRPNVGVAAGLAAQYRWHESALATVARAA